MYQVPNLDLFMFEHSHGDDDWHQMHEVAPGHDASSHDPERKWGRGLRIFRCDSCAEEIRVGSPGASTDQDRAPGPA